MKGRPSWLCRYLPLRWLLSFFWASGFPFVKEMGHPILDLCGVMGDLKGSRARGPQVGCRVLSPLWTPWASPGRACLGKGLWESLSENAPFAVLLQLPGALVEACPLQ